jgi:hypothetical protein
VLTELGLVRLSLDPVACRVLDAPRTELERSQEFRDCAARLAEIERALAGELRPPAAARAA